MLCLVVVRTYGRNAGYLPPQRPNASAVGLAGLVAAAAGTAAFTGKCFMLLCLCCVLDIIVQRIVMLFHSG